MAALGYTVYATIRDTQGRNADKAQVLEAIENITVLDVTLTDDESVTQAVETILTREGRIDVLVNNAGYAMIGVFEGYGVIAEIPNKMIAALTAEMQAKNPNPQQVADAIIKLIATPKGTRTLRTVVYPITGQYNAAANEAIAEQFAKGLTIFGMGELLLVKQN